MIPTNWDNTLLGNLTYESRLRAKDIPNGLDLPVYGVDNVVGLNPSPRYTADEFDRYKVITNGMFAYNPMRLNIGSLGYSFKGYADGLVSPDYVVFGCNETLLHSDFMYHYTKSHRWISQMRNMGSGSVRFRIYYKDLAEFSILLPPLAEQRQIAAILSTWDEAITLTEQLIDALQRRKQALMQLLLTGAVRFPAFDREWEEVELGSYIDLFTGFAFSSEDFQDEAGIRLLRGINITAGETRWSDNLTKYWPNSEGLGRYLLQENDIVVGMDGSLVGRNYAMLTSEDLPALLVQRVARLRAELQMVQDYLYHNIASDSFVRYVDSVKTVTAIPHISPKDIREFKIGFPSKEEQSKIADALNISENEVRLLEKFREALKIQKRGLMQQLLTGTVRVQV